MVNYSIKDFSITLMRRFEPGLSGEALITSVVTAAKVPLNAARVASKMELTEAFEKALTSTLKFLYELEAAKDTDPIVRKQSLIHAYRAAEEAKCKLLKKQVAAEAARADELATAVTPLAR